MPEPQRTILLDASAVLAVLNAEPGAEVVREALRTGAVMSSVNLAEVLAKLSDHGLDHTQAKAVVRELRLKIVPFTRTNAERSAELRKVTKPRGLSLGDRACLATGSRLGARVLTTERQWREVVVENVAVEVVR